MSEGAFWTPYPHEDVRVRLLWRKRLVLAAILGLIFLLWALSLGVTTETTEELTVFGGDGGSVTIQKPEDSQVEPSARVSLTPGETARLDDPLTLRDGETQPGDQGVRLPEQPEGVPFFGLLLLIGPFILAFLLWRYLGNQGTSTEVNYGIYKGAMPFEAISASHKHLVLTSRKVEENPFGREETDYLDEAYGDLASRYAEPHPPAVAE